MNKSQLPIEDPLGTVEKKLNNYSKLLLNYNNEDWQEAARSIIPIETLKERALKRISQESDTPLSYKDELLKQLLAWFKYEFYNWVNNPLCESCSSETEYVESPPANETEANLGVTHIELYRCKKCGELTRFPRYTNAKKLLETKRGRCSEWSQCFNLCARSLGYETRLVYDWTDHVFNEIYSEDQKRWIHCDSCENSMNSPLLYETGWGKKLTYVIAVSVDEILDVTRKYTKNYKDVLTRRDLVPEDWLAEYFQNAKLRLEEEMSAERKVVLEERRQVEEMELRKWEGEKKDEEKENEAHGRISGSIEWRAERGELGDLEKTLLAEKRDEEKKKELLE